MQKVSGQKRTCPKEEMVVLPVSDFGLAKLRCEKKNFSPVSLVRSTTACTHAFLNTSTFTSPLRTMAEDGLETKSNKRSRSEDEGM
jgi:hypothetical protein